MDFLVRLLHSIRPHRVFLFLLFIPVSAVWSQLPKLATKADLPEILRLSRTDPVYQLERQAAIEFNKLINQYRRNHYIPQLIWSDDIWIAARNHSLYMTANNQLTHTQRKTAKNFTGVNINDRLGVVIQRWLNATFGKNSPQNQGIRMRKSYTWGENVYTQPNVSVTRNNVALVARSIAQVAFDGWKKSPGHNKNMLSKDYKAHAIAFILYQNRIYATDDFAGYIEVAVSR